MFCKRLLIVFSVMIISFVVSLSCQTPAYAVLSFEGRILQERSATLTTEQTLEIILRVYDDEFGGQLLFAEKQKVVTSEGKFLFVFESGEITVSKIADNATTENFWVEVESDGQIMSPRLSLADIGSYENLTGTTCSISAARLFSAGTPTVVIDTNGVTFSGRIDMGSQAIRLGGVSRTTWPSSDDSAYVEALEARIAALENLLEHFSRDGNEITISGANLNIINGSGSTDGTVNGKGNLVIGYNESRDPSSGDDRSGSHNLILGSQNNFSSYGGMVAGSENEISDIYASVSGGRSNTANGRYSTVSGGRYNTASGTNSSVSGGQFNEANGANSTTSGGYYNRANGDYSSISGGEGGTAYGEKSSISGGIYGSASGANSSVNGGWNNMATKSYSTVSGGYINTAGGDFSSVSGGESNSASGHYSSILGGVNNSASGVYSSVYGGENQTASGLHSYKP
ncbi:MAG: hypothetical protein KAI69_04020 [Deltaproteobacteria bacterium]|nr:hypothetical protein [Deltaproteobacteria bacterium]